MKALLFILAILGMVLGASPVLKAIKVTSDLVPSLQSAAPRRPPSTPGPRGHLMQFSQKMGHKLTSKTPRSLNEGRPSPLPGTPEDRELLAQLDLPPNSLDFFSSLPDAGMRVQAEELKAFMRKLAPAVGGKKKDEGKTYLDYLKVAKKKLVKMRKQQLSRYAQWRKESWQNINKYLEASQRIFDANDSLNVSENEKYYQLFLVEDGQKRQHLIPFVDLENRLLAIIEGEMEVLADEKSLKKASLRQTARLSNRLARRSRRASHRSRRDYVRGIRDLDRQYMKAWNRNQLFVGEETS